LRKDTGALFENFMIAERLKYIQLQEQQRNLWFWRTHDGKEIDYIKEFKGYFHAYELKWGRNKMKKATTERFRNSYQQAEFKIISRENYFEFF
jgi:uncharacterized protein